MLHSKTPVLCTILLASILLLAACNDSHEHGHDEQGHNQESHGEHSNSEAMHHWMAPKVESERKNPIEKNAESIQQGEQLFAKNCASCHGDKAEGNGAAAAQLDPKPTNLKTMANQHPDGDFAYKIRTGRGAMPAWENSLTDTEVWHLVNFIKSLKPE